MSLMKKMQKEDLIEQTLLKNYDKYYRLAKSYTHNSDDAFDIVQNGACRAIMSGKKLKDEALVETWLYRIMLNEVFRFCKTNKNLLFVPQDMAPETGHEDTYENFDLQVALDRLEPKDKSVVILKYFEDMKISEIAQVLNEKENTVKSRLYRSLDKLRLQLNP
ncbi:MAG: sigma-70 family RNA polymerase sigma factor [Lachnospiraceae bacterium]|nr:sigma-70 family RNA polymerase sigma factor [Lachnospiraceae bacterium]